MQHPNSPRRYKLMQDLLGWDEGTVFRLVSPDPKSATQFTPYYTAEGSVEGNLPVKGVEGSPDLFQSSEQGRPYPWEPKHGDFFECVYANHVAPMHTTQHDTADFVEAGNAFRTKEDAELRLKAEPLVNAAVKALINRGDWKPRPCEDSHFIPEWVGGKWRPSLVSMLIEDDQMGDEYESEEDCQAICDLYNFFLTPPHA